MDPWLHVVGIGEDGMAGLSPAARALVEAAEVIIGGERHHRLSDAVSAERLAWPSPFDAMIETMRAHRGRRLVVLVTGDPLWYSVGARLTKAIPADEIRFWPQLSAFQWAACRLGWSLADLDCVTAHGRPPEHLIPFFAPGARLLMLTKDETTAPTVARLLRERGYGGSRLIAFEALGGPSERRHDGDAATWSAPDLGPFYLLAAELVAAPGAAIFGRTGLPDAAFRHDGKITKREARALALARLKPARGRMLWDVGAGCGSIGVEWMRSARDMACVALEPNADRRAMAAENALALGAPRLEIRDGRAPEALAGLSAPDAVFIGGGLSRETVETCLAALKPFGRLVAHAVTLESEALLIALHAQRGGDLTKLSVARADAIGDFRGWRPLMPVTQWVLER